MKQVKDSRESTEISLEQIEETFALLELDADDKRLPYLKYYQALQQAEEVTCIWASDSGHFILNQGES